MSGKVAKAKEDKDASKGKMRALYVCPWNHIFTRLRSHSSPLCCSDQPVRLDWKQWQHWMANHFPAWCMWLLLAGEWGGHRPAYVLRVWNHVHLSKSCKRNASVFVLHWQKERWWPWNDGRDILLSLASCWNAPLCFSLSPYVCSVSSHTNRNHGTPRPSKVT